MARLRPVPYELSLSYKYPTIANQAYGWNPREVFARSNTKLDWICDLGHTWSESPTNRVTGLNCPYCSGQRVKSGFNDIATTHPELAKEAYGWDPSVMSRGMVKKLTWKCSEYGHTWDEKIGHRTYYNTGCPYCSGKRVLVGFNDLATTHPKIAKEAYNWDPTTVSRGSAKKMQWQCSYGHVWTCSPQTRTCLETGCPKCNGSGFDSTKSGYLYMLCQPDWGLTQIGITNYPQRRLEKHKKSGWKLLNLVHPISGKETRRIETSIKRWLRSEEIANAYTPDGSKFDGYTESWSEQDLFVSSIYELCQLAGISTQINKWNLIEDIK